jgi:hypothetical protein
MDIGNSSPSVITYQDRGLMSKVKPFLAETGSARPGKLIDQEHC